MTDDSVLRRMAWDWVGDLRACDDVQLRALVRSGTITGTVKGTPAFDTIHRRIASMAAQVLGERERLGRAARRAALPPVGGEWGESATSSASDGPGDVDAAAGQAFADWQRLVDLDPDDPEQPPELA